MCPRTKTGVILYYDSQVNIVLYMCEVCYHYDRTTSVSQHMQLIHYLLQTCAFAQPRTCSGFSIIDTIVDWSHLHPVERTGVHSTSLNAFDAYHDNVRSLAYEERFIVGAIFMNHVCFACGFSFSVFRDKGIEYSYVFGDGYIDDGIDDETYNAQQRVTYESEKRKWDFVQRLHDSENQ